MARVKRLDSRSRSLAPSSQFDELSWSRRPALEKMRSAIVEREARFIAGEGERPAKVGESGRRAPDLVRQCTIADLQQGTQCSKDCGKIASSSKLHATADQCVYQREERERETESSPSACLPLPLQATANRRQELIFS